MPKNCLLIILMAYTLSTLGLVKADVASKEFLNKQKTVFELLWRVDQPHLVNDHHTVGKNYKIEEHFGSYTNQQCVPDFLKLYKKGMLPRGETFSVFYPTLREEAIALFRVFYYSKDFETLYKTAAWARIHLNEGMFVYAFSVAVFHHPETQRLRVPALHETYPNLYFGDEVIKKAFDAKTSIDVTKPLSSEEIIIPANYSRFYQKYDWSDENTLSYYTEDIGVTEIQYYAHLAHPFWMSAKEFPNIVQSRGDRFFWSYKLQFLRYNMERLANGMGEVEDFDWNYPVPYGYHPSNSYRNGLSLPHREANAHFPKFYYKAIQDLKTWEYGISQAIDSGYMMDTNGKFVPIRSQQGLKILGNLVEGNANSANPDAYGKYDILARTVLGFTPEPLGTYTVFPSTMELYGLDQRDPIYWSYVKKIVGFYEKFTSKLPYYTHEELAFPDVEINSLVVDRITTFFSPADYLISNAVKAFGPQDKVLIKARQYRLDHKPYTYTINVTSKVAGPAVIRLFLGPKYNEKHEEISITENWKNIMTLDEWTVELKVGSNKFERFSSPTLNAVPDEVSGDVFYKKILAAIEGKGTYEIPNQRYGFPERVIIPKGSEEGTTFQLWAMIIPHDTGKIFHSRSPILGERKFKDLPLGFPFDRPVKSSFTDLRNVRVEDIKIYHQKESQLNLTV